MSRRSRKETAQSGRRPAPADTAPARRTFGTADARPARRIPRRVEALLFGLVFFASAYFCPGGGWNQNARFDQVRAIVEGGTFAINDFLVYGPGEGDSAELERRPLPAGTPVDRVATVGNTGDVTGHNDRIYPGKPPGTVLLAVPAYWVIHQVEKRLGVNPDTWRTLTLNAYLTRLLSVGLLSAAGAIVFLRLSQRLFPRVDARAQVLAALTLSFATLLWPFSTLFFDHNVVAVLLLGALALLVRVRDDCGPADDEDEWAGMSFRSEAVDLASDAPTATGAARRLFAAGALLGLAVVCNYVAIIAVVIFTVYALVMVRPVWRLMWLWAGGLAPALFLAWYHYTCFGSVAATANADEPVMFQDERLLLGMFGVPEPGIVFGLLLSTYRGLFFFSPILGFALFVAVLAVAMRQRRAEMLASLAVFIAYVAMNASFQGWSKAWTGGWSFGPRYLIPGVALLALPLCAAFDRLPRLTLAVAVYSFLLTLLGTTVDPQPPVGFKRPIGDYLGPLALGETVTNGRREISGRVSANPIGVYESFYDRVFPAASPQAQWNSFNLGEFLWPQSRLSLLPLLAVLGGGFWLLWRWARTSAECGVRSAE